MSDRLSGGIVGDVFPPQAPPPQRPDDARREAIMAWREYLAREVTFWRRMAPGQPAKKFRVPIEQVLPEQPDDPTELKFPAIVVLPALGPVEPIALGPPFQLEETRDQFGVGTVLVHKGEYVEEMTVELWADSRAERRALVAAFKRAMRQSEDSWSLRINVPAFYDSVAEFTLQRTQYVDDADAVRNRRRAQAVVELRVADLELVNYRELRPYISEETEDGALGSED